MKQKTNDEILNEYFDVADTNSGKITYNKILNCMDLAQKEAVKGMWTDEDMQDFLAKYSFEFQNNHKSSVDGLLTQYKQSLESKTK